MNDEIRKYQCDVVEILRRDYFMMEDNWLIGTQEVIKNNDLKLSGITIRKSLSNVSPTYYVNGYYERGYMPEATAQDIARNYEKDMLGYRKELEVGVQQIKDYEATKNKICYKLVNTKANSDYLKDAPHIKISDELSLAFYIQYTDEATIPIFNNFIDTWGLEASRAGEELYRVAERNMTKLHPPVLDSMTDVLGVVSEMEGVEEIKQMAEFLMPMYVLTNNRKIFGASVIAYNKGQVLEDCRRAIEDRLGKDIDTLVIIPSSVHEVILMPANEIDDLNELMEMISFINGTELRPEERLSNNVFGYNKAEGFHQLTFDNREICR